MSLREFVEMAVCGDYKCYVYDNLDETNVFEGNLSDIPDKLLDMDVTSWEIDSGKIGLNVEEIIPLF